MKFVDGIWREKAPQEAQSVVLLLGYRLLGLSCMLLSLELAGAALWLWAQLVDASLPEAAAVGASLVLLLCVLGGAVCWTRCWLCLPAWLVLRANIAAGRGDWAQWAWLRPEDKHGYGSFASTLVLAGLTVGMAWIWGIWGRAPTGQAGTREPERGPSAVEIELPPNSS